jgi:anti-sigma F factor
MNLINEMSLSFPSKSSNEAFARSAVSAFVIGLDPTVAELSDIKTAVSEAVTNCIVHGYRRENGTVYINGKICKLNSEYEKENGREMSITELSKALNVSEDKICEALAAGCSPLSLNADYDDDGNSRIDIPVSDKQEEITERLSLKNAIAELDERDRQIIHLRYFQNKTQSQTADRPRARNLSDEITFSSVTVVPLPTVDLTFTLSQKLCITAKPRPALSSSGAVVKSGSIAFSISAMPQPLSRIFITTLLFS